MYSKTGGHSYCVCFYVCMLCVGFSITMSNECTCQTIKTHICIKLKSVVQISKETDDHHPTMVKTTLPDFFFYPLFIQKKIAKTNHYIRLPKGDTTETATKNWNSRKYGVLINFTKYNLSLKAMLVGICSTCSSWQMKKKSGLKS